MKAVELKENKKIKAWLGKKKSANTAINYCMAMQYYTELIGKKPEELIEEAENELRNGKLMRERNIQQYFDEFQDDLEDREFADNTIRGYIAAIRSFYKKSHIETPEVKFERRVKTLKKNRKTPTKKDLQDVVGVCDKLEKAIVLVGISGGLSDVDIVDLRITDFERGFDPETNITTLELTRIKPDFDFITFLSPEANEAIKEYLNYRSREAKTSFTRENDRLDKQKVKNNNGYLFIKKHVPTSYLSSGNEEERKITPKNLIQIYKYISEKAQKNTPSGDWNLIRSHNMRKYFYNTMHNAGCKYLNLEFMMGHSLNTTTDAYFRPTLDELKTDYLKCYPYLTIHKELDVSESPEYIKMKSENEVLAREVATATVEREELKRMQKNNDIQNIKHTIQILKMQRRIEPEHTEKINKMIKDLEKQYDVLTNYADEEFIDYTDQDLF